MEPDRGAVADRWLRKSFVAANLVLSLARLSTIRTPLLDLDLRAPGLARTFDISKAGSVAPMLSAQRPPERHLFRIGDNLALGLNDKAATDPACLLPHRTTRRHIGGSKHPF